MEDPEQPHVGELGEVLQRVLGVGEVPLAQPHRGPRQGRQSALPRRPVLGLEHRLDVADGCVGEAVLDTFGGHDTFDWGLLDICCCYEQMH